MSWREDSPRTSPAARMPGTAVRIRRSVTIWPLPFKGYDPVEQAAVGRQPGVDEHAGDLQLGGLAGLKVFEPHPLNTLPTLNRPERGVPSKAELIGLTGAVLQGAAGPQRVPAGGPA